MTVLFHTMPRADYFCSFIYRTDRWHTLTSDVARVGSRGREHPLNLADQLTLYKPGGQIIGQIQKAIYTSAYKGSMYSILRI